MPCGGGAGVLSKKSMNAPKGEHMDAGNTFAVLTTLAFLAVLPVALAVEGPAMAAAWAKALEGPYSQNELITRQSEGLAQKDEVIARQSEELARLRK